MQLKEKCEIVIQHLKDQAACYIDEAKKCLSFLRTYFARRKEEYSTEAGNNWIANRKKNIPAYEKSINMLNELVESGTIDCSAQVITKKTEPTNIEMDFINDLRATNTLAETTIGKYRRCGRLFIYYLSEYQLITDVHVIKYEHVISFYSSMTYEKYRRVGMQEFLQRFTLFLYQRKIKPYAFVLTIHFLGLGRGCYWNHIDVNLAQLIEKQKTSSCTLPSYSEYHDFTCKILRTIKENNYSKNEYLTYKKIYDIFYIFMEMNSVLYQKELFSAWIKSNCATMDRSSKNTWFRALDLLETQINNGEVNLHDIFWRKEKCIDQLGEWCKSIVFQFLELKTKEKWKPSTINMYRSSITAFCTFLEKQGISSFSDLTPECVKKFNLTDEHTTLAGKNAYISRIRKFLYYLSLKGYTKNPKLEYALITAHAPRETFVDVLSEEQVQTLYKKLESGSCSYLKKAIVLIGLQMGIRASDIVELKLEDIDFKHVSLKFVQQKTSKEIELPIPTKVANTLYQYLLNERPQTDSRYLFVQGRAPYGKYHRSKPYHILKELLPDLEKGFHITRKTFASSLLDRGSSIEDVSLALGHEGIQSVHNYLSIDGERMKMCAISLEEEGLIFSGKFE